MRRELFIRMSTAAIEREAERTSILLSLGVVREFFYTFAVPQDDPTFCHVSVCSPTRKRRTKRRRRTSSSFLLSQKDDLLSLSQSETACGALPGWDVVGSMLLFSTLKETLLPCQLPSKACNLPRPGAAPPPGKYYLKVHLAMAMVVAVNFNHFGVAN